MKSFNGSYLPDDDIKQFFDLLVQL